MAVRDTPDGSRNASEGLHNMLTGLTIQSPVSSPRSGLSMNTSLNADAPSTTHNILEQATTPPPLPTLFNNPNHSIFASGPPTSSVSASTAQASLTGALPTNSVRPLSALTGSCSHPPRVRQASGNRTGSPDRSEVRNLSLSSAEKDMDDPTLHTEAEASVLPAVTPTPSRVSRIPAPPDATTRQALHSQKIEYTRRGSETTSLPDHLFTRGFRDGRYSDITIHAFSKSYALHRLLLDRSPFFASALSAPWYESKADEVSLHPEEMDPHISQKAFELALGRLYGLVSPDEEREEPMGLLATGCWLEMTDLIETSVDLLMQQMCTKTLGEVIHMVSNNYYGKPGERLLASAKVMLLREGWEMPLRYWDGISGDMIRHIVGGDGFFVSGEWERWLLAKRLLIRRQLLEFERNGLLESVGGRKRASAVVNKAEKDPSLRAYLRTNALQNPVWPREDTEAGGSIYAQPDVAAIALLLDHGIHYIHMSFEQLQLIRNEVDCAGQPIVRAETIMKALWMSTDLRQMIMNAPGNALELGLKQPVLETAKATENDASASGDGVTSTDVETQSRRNSNNMGFDAVGPDAEASKQRSLDPYKVARRYYIPNCDSTKIIGDMYNTGLRSTTIRVPSKSHMPVPVRADESNPFLTHLSDRPRTPGNSRKSQTSSKIASDKSGGDHYVTRFPPCRFAVEFPNPRTMREKKRVYSRTVWYAGSMWNVYIQKVQSPKNVQLGVYLHRVRDREGNQLLGEPFGLQSTEDAISQLQQEMWMRRCERQARRRRSEDHVDSLDDLDSSSEENTIGYAVPVALGNRSGFNQPHRAIPSRNVSDRLDRFSPNRAETGREEPIEVAMKKAAARTPALPPYVDRRPAIKTYFKIYQMSPGGRTMSVHKSTPDRFNFSQSWGWRVVLDDSAMGHESEDGGESSSNNHNHGELRLSIVLGNV